MRNHVHMITRTKLLHLTFGYNIEPISIYLRLWTKC